MDKVSDLASISDWRQIRDNPYILEQGRYYLEHSNDPPEEVLWRHQRGDADSIFTKKFKPITFILEQNKTSKDEFETILFGYMLDFGINNVRGGKYFDLIWTHEQYNTIKTMIGKITACHMFHIIWNIIHIIWSI